MSDRRRTIFVTVGDEQAVQVADLIVAMLGLNRIVGTVVVDAAVGEDKP